jgi:hypothetical protein
MAKWPQHDGQVATPETEPLQVLTIACVRYSVEDMESTPPERRRRIYWPLVRVSIGIGVIAVPIGLAVTFAFVFSGFCDDSGSSCSGPEPISHYVAGLVVVTAVWATVVAIFLYNREDVIPFPAVLIGLAATTVAFHGVLWSGVWLAIAIHSWYPLLLIPLAPFVAAVLGGYVAMLIWNAGAVVPDA